MALYEIDRRGSHYDDLRAGTVASMVANVNRDTKRRPEPYGPLHFMTWNEMHQEEPELKPIYIDDADAQSKLIAAALFGKKE